jgi:hypothetical protein
MEKGSRQLLICLGWLIYHIKLIENCMKQCLNSDSIFDHDDTSSLYQVSEKIDCVKYSPQGKNLIGQIKQAMRINSKLRFGLRRLHGLVIENANLQHQVNRLIFLLEINLFFFRYMNVIICHHLKHIFVNILIFYHM